MAKSLVIVESPAKAKSIGKFLGRSYSVKASMGHVRDLPKSQFGVDIEHDFSPRYITVRGQGKTLAELRSAVKKAGKVYLATDPDREGEAISWHLAEALGLSAHTANRIEFHEITKQAVQKAIKSPRNIDHKRVDAQQARRVLDRVVGYKLSPLLWAKVKRGLSAGRVQSVALRLVADREAEIDAFVPEEYWSITATLEKTGGGAFTAKFIGRGGEKVELGTQAETESVVEQLQAARYEVAKVTRRERRRSPAAPFTTSTLQQEASRRLGFSARKTMSLAQQLYEGLDIEGHGTLGLITYLRTDSTRISPEAQDAARQLIEARWGRDYRPEKPPVYRTKSSAQDAHEAIRPTLVELSPDAVKKDLSRDQARLYRLIWERFVASQMAPAVMDTLTVDIDALGSAGPPPWQLRATGSTLKFAGFMTLYIERQDDEVEEAEGVLPDFAEGEALGLDGLEPKQHFTQPPPRFTEASLVKTLEELGIGRPSTYVAIIDTLRKRGSATMEERRFVP
ncbi:MAG TPA: type I DNA topoisomerase, partial [Limnochordia bacterium]|nr:type I DNA topoisomerase [Limnochordia bacterium]